MPTYVGNVTPSRDRKDLSGKKKVISQSGKKKPEPARTRGVPNPVARGPSNNRIEWLMIDDWMQGWSVGLLASNRFEVSSPEKEDQEQTGDSQSIAFSARTRFTLLCGTGSDRVLHLAELITLQSAATRSVHGFSLVSFCSSSLHSIFSLHKVVFLAVLQYKI